MFVQCDITSRLYTPFMVKMSVRMFTKDHYVILWPPWLRWRLRSVITSILALAFVWIITISARYRSSVTDGPDSEALQDAFQVEFGTAHDVRNEMYFTGGTLSLTSNDGQTTDPLTHPQPIVYDPYPAYNSQDWNRTWRGSFRPCMGPRARELDRTDPEDMMLVYLGNQRGAGSLASILLQRKH
jgi:hypothetical protein